MTIEVDLPMFMSMSKFRTEGGVSLLEKEN
jgi:hypothetical protein